MTSVEARDGWLEIGFGGGVAAFELGHRAAAWAGKIRNPRTRIDKIGVRRGTGSRSSR